MALDLAFLAFFPVQVPVTGAHCLYFPLSPQGEQLKDSRERSSFSWDTGHREEHSSLNHYETVH